jgi:IclR family mhp operon transcriptional activator
MESTRPIRALMRGLDALTILNLHDGATVSEVAQEIRLPRTTVYRILETLCDSGFAARDAADDRYRLTLLVRGLSHGFADEAWIAGIASPCVEELGRELVWPVSLATLSGTRMMLRETTDHATPLALERYSAGFRAPLLGSAPGRAYLAFCPGVERDSLLDRLAQSDHEDDLPARAPRADLLRMLNDISTQGYAIVTRTRRLVDEVSASVPVMVHDRVLAAITVRFVSSTVPQRSALERFLPKLRLGAAKIGGLFLEDQAPAKTESASNAAA